MKQPVLNKHDGWLRWLKGEFGNRPLAWLDYQELLSSDYRGEVTVRCKDSTHQALTYGVPFDQIRAKLDEFNTRFKTTDSLYAFNESQDDSGLIFQGEFLLHCDPRIAPHWYVYYSTHPGKMRPSLQNYGKHAYGLEAKLLMEHYLDPISLEWLTQLCEDYPDHVVEFSTYASRRGHLYMPTIIWEVRAF
jgi:hypothetical protein